MKRARNTRANISPFTISNCVQGHTNSLAITTSDPRTNWNRPPKIPNRPVNTLAKPSPSIPPSKRLKVNTEMTSNITSLLNCEALAPIDCRIASSLLLRPKIKDRKTTDDARVANTATTY